MISESGKNAIWTLLHLPTLPPGPQPHAFAPASALKKRSTVEGILSGATNIKLVEAVEFEPYLSQVGPLYELLLQVKDSEDVAWLRRGSKSDGLFKSHGDSRKSGGQSGPSQRQRNVNYSRNVHSDSPQLSTIPSIYFSEDFHLENPRTFNVVSERSSVVMPLNLMTEQVNSETPSTSRKALATNAILQEKLSWYMDTVEMHLIHSIPVASATIFSALESLGTLNSEAADSVEKIRTLRRDLTSLDRDVVNRGLELLQKRQRHHDLHQLNNAVLQLRRIVNRFAYCKLLIEEGKVENALAEIDAIDTIELVIATSHEETLEDETFTHVQSRGIRGVVALRDMASDLTTLRSQIGKVFESKVHSLLIEDLQRHVNSVSIEEVLRWEAASLRAKGVHARELSAFPAYMSTTEELYTALFPNISGFYRCGYISTAIQAYRELVLREIGYIVRKLLPTSTEDTESTSSVLPVSEGRGRTDQEKASILARKIRALGAEDAERLLSTIYISIAETLRRLETQSRVVLEISRTIGQLSVKDSIKSPVSRSLIGSRNTDENTSIFKIQEEIHAAFDLPSLLSQAVDVSHEKIDKVLQVRSEQTTGLPLIHFLRYFILTLLFVNECEAISGRAGELLRTTVNSHIEDFIKSFRDRTIQTLFQGMKTDNWREKDFTAEDNEILKQTLECSTLNLLSWTQINKLQALLSEEGSEETKIAQVSETHSVVKDKVRGATIEGRTFLLPRSAIICLKGTLHFLYLMGNIPSMTPDIIMSLIEYLQMFDSRCRKLILRGRAIRSGGLEKITAKHLALTSQALSFIETVMLHIRRVVRRHAQGGLLSEFDKIRLSLQEQQDGVHQKLVKIMESRAVTLSKKACETEWGRESAEGVREYMTDLVKDTDRLYRSISKYMPEEEVMLVMAPMFMSFKEKLGKTFSEADLDTETGRECMLCDVEHLVSKLGTVKEFGDLGTYLVKIIESKEVKTTLSADPLLMAEVRGETSNE
ncbi:Vps54-like protein-domain-containing protein [Xylogone sp. PMI_703]|nr:Vps54-like protein-domain-containing protein [Xylogone sp. PMI_703]